MIEVLGHRVLVKPYDVKESWQEAVPEDLKNLGFEISLGSTEEEKRHKLGMDRGTVVGIGNMCWKNEALGWGSDDWKPWCKVGDSIGFARYAGKMVIDPFTKEEFYIMNDVDVQVVFREEA